MYIHIYIHIHIHTYIDYLFTEYEVLTNECLCFPYAGIYSQKTLLNKNITETRKPDIFLFHDVIKTSYNIVENIKLRQIDWFLNFCLFSISHDKSEV